MEKRLTVARTAKVQIDKSFVSTHYLEGGKGFPIILLHGLGDSAYTWQWVIEPLARNHRVYAFSFPGFGESDKPRASYSPEFFVSFTGAFMDKMEIDKAILVGNSLGGSVVIYLALQRKRHIVLDRLNRLDMPTLVIWGERDKVIPLQHGRAAVSRLPRGEFAVFKDCGHLPHIEAADRFLQSIESFTGGLGYDLDDPN